MIVCGLAATQVLNRQFFPDFGLDYVTVSIVWPGASALDVDESLVNSIEPAVRFIDGVKKVSSSSYEGLANITIEFESGHDMQLGLAEVESAVGQITTLPLDAEKPRIKRLLRYETVSKLVLSGADSERALKHYAKKVRDHLLIVPQRQGERGEPADGHDVLDVPPGRHVLAFVQLRDAEGDEQIRDGPRRAEAHGAQGHGVVEPVLVQQVRVEENQTRARASPGEDVEQGLEQVLRRVGGGERQDARFDGTKRCRPRNEPRGTRVRGVAVETETRAREKHVPSPGPYRPPFGRPCRLYTATRARRVLGYLRERSARLQCPRASPCSRAFRDVRNRRTRA